MPEEVLPKGVRLVTTDKPLPKGVRLVLEEEGPKNLNQNRPVTPQEIAQRKEKARLQEIKYQQQREEELVVAEQIKTFAGKKATELKAAKPPAGWEKVMSTNDRGDEVEVMKRSTESLQYDLAVKTYERIAEIDPKDMGSFIDGFRAGGDKGLDVEGTLRLLPFVGSIIDYNESDLLNEAAMKGKPNPSEEELLLAKNLQLQMQFLVNKGRWKEVGVLMSQMVPLAGEFLLTKGLGGEVSTATRGYAATLIKDVPKAARVLKGFAAASRSGLGSAVIQTGVNIPRIAATAEARKTPEMGELEIDKQGNFVAKPLTAEAKAKVEGTWEATLKAFGSGVVENFTERFGGFADELFLAMRAKGLGITKAALEKTLKGVGENGLDALRKKFKSAGVDSFIGEVFLEEVPSQVLTSVVTGDELNLDFDQLLNLGISAGIPGGVVTATAIPRALGYMFGKIKPKLAPVAAEGKPVTQSEKYEVTGEINIQRVTTGPHAAEGAEVIEYSTGLKNKKTGEAIVVHEINDGKSVMFQTPEGEFVGSSVEDVADQVQRAGLPQVTEAQVTQAEKVIGAGGYNKASFKKALIEVFNYPEKQAETVSTIADKMVQTMAKRQGITPDQAYNQIKLARGVINEAGEIVEEVPVKKAPSKADKALAEKLKLPVSKLQEAEIDDATGKYKAPPLQESGGKALGAYVPMGGGRGLIYAFRHADVTTALHEMSHHYENVLTAAEKAKISEWSGAKVGTREFSESFARGFETFLKKGEVKSPEMKAAFQKFRAYLSDVINKWIESGRQLSAPMENLYRDMLGEEAVEELKEKANAISIEETADVPVQPTPGDSKAVGEKVSKEETAAKGKEEKASEKVGEKTGKALGKAEEIIDGGIEVLGALMKKLDKASAEFKAYKNNFTSKDDFIGFRRWLVDNKEKLNYYGSAVSYSSDLFITDRAAFDNLYDTYREETKEVPEPVREKAEPEPTVEEKKKPEPKKEEGPRAEGSMKKFEHPEMENPVYSVIANGQEKFIQRIETNEGHRWIEVQKEGGVWATVKHDNLFENYLGDTSREGIETLQRIGKPLTQQEAIEKITGDASVEQPAMQPAKAETPDAYIETIKKQPKKEAPKPPKRSPVHQPTEDVESTSEAVVEALKGLDFVPDTVSDLTDFVASLDENGKPLGPGRAFAIVQQMQVDGFIEINGKKVSPLFQRRPLFQQKNDYMTDAQKQVLDAVEKAAASYSPVANMQAQGFAAFRDWVKQVELGAKGDFNTTVKAIGSALNVTVDEARNIYASIKGTKAPKLGPDAKGFFEAWGGGRGSIFTQYGAAWTHFTKQVKDAKLSETVNPLNWTRIISLPVSAFTSIVQSAKTFVFGNLEAGYITPRVRALGDWFADKMKAGVTHRTLFIRTASQVWQGFYRGLAYTSAGVEAQSRLRGGVNEGHILAQKLMVEMYTLVGRDANKIQNVHAVLDPEVYVGTSREGITAASLSADEALLYQTLKDNMELLHEHSFARGYISEETYLRHRAAGGYFGRAYEEILDGEMYGKDLSDAFGSIRSDFSIYTRRKDFEEIELTIEKDPIFIAAQRMATAVANQAVTDYANYIADTANSKIITYSKHDFDALKAQGKMPRGFTLLRGFERGGGIYGFLTNRYVPNYIAYDFKGFFLTSKLGQTFYNGIKMYDRHWIRQEMKKTLTAYNPAVFIGNQSSNYTFAFLNDVDLFNFNIMLAEADKSIDEQDVVYNKLVAAGIIGADIHGSELTPLRIQEKTKATAKANPSLVTQGKGFLNKVVTAYSKTDDRAKIAAYRVKTEVQGKTSEQAITEILTGFQNYQNVGMIFDIASKLPVFGNAFAKFLGDVRRIAITSIAYRPLTTAAYIGTIYGLQALASGMSGEDDEAEAIREGRPFQPRIPFLDMPLTFKFGGKEINLARYIFPYTVYDKGEADDSMWNSFCETISVQPYVTNSGGKPGYLKFDDPIIGPWFSLLTDKDFRGMSVANPTKTADSAQQRWNQAEYLIRSFGWLPTTATDMYHIALEGEDYYGRNRSKTDRIISTFIRVEEFNDPEVRKTMVKQIRNLGYDVERIHDKMNKLVRDGKKNIIAIENNTTITEEQRARKLDNEINAIQKSLVELADEYKEANKKLTDAASYNIDIAKKLNEKKAAD